MLAQQQKVLFIKLKVLGKLIDELVYTVEILDENRCQLAFVTTLFILSFT